MLIDTVLPILNNMVHFTGGGVEYDIVGSVENDFEKGAAQGSHSAWQVIHLAATAWLARAASPGT